jgi:hypothetical protein
MNIPCLRLKRLSPNTVQFADARNFFFFRGESDVPRHDGISKRHTIPKWAKDFSVFTAVKLQDLLVLYVQFTRQRTWQERGIQCTEWPYRPDIPYTAVRRILHQDPVAVLT